jgi:hypothetical protein
MKPEKRNQAMALFLNGFSHRQIALELLLARSTVNRWSVKDKWIQARLDGRQQAIKAVKDRFSIQETNNTESAHIKTQEILQNAICELSAYSHGLLTKKQMKFTSRDILNLAKALNHFQTDLKNEKN